MKNTKRAIALLLAVITMLASLMLSASAVSENRQQDSMIGGQAVYVTTNRAWNTNLPGKLFNTVMRIILPIDCSDAYSSSKAKKNAAIQIAVYKKMENRWVKQCKLCGKFNCNAYSGLLENGLRLPGKNVQYKIVITPERTKTVRVPSDMTGIKISLNYGTITDVR